MNSNINQTAHGKTKKSINPNLFKLRKDIMFKQALHSWFAEISIYFLQITTTF